MRLLKMPEPHQRDAIKFLSSRSRGLLSYLTGTGKSLCQICTSLRLIKDGSIKKFLVVATKNSAIELKKDFGTFADHAPEVLKSKDDIVRFLSESDNLVGIMQYNVIDEREAVELVPVFAASSVAVSFDEFHTLKNPKAAVTLTYRALRSSMKMCYGATATGIMSDLDDLFWLVDFLEPGYLGTKSAFDKKYKVRKLEPLWLGRGKKRMVWKTVGYQNLDDLGRRLEDVIVKFYPPMDIAYESLWGELSDLGTYGEIARGIIRGRVDGEKSEELEHHSARMNALQDLVNNDRNKQALLLGAVRERLSGGVIVYCSYYESLDIVADLLNRRGIPYNMINGKMTTPQREEAKKWFVDDPRGKVFLITTAGGQSLNLQATNKLIMYDIPFSIGHYIQIMGRVVRLFSEFKSFEIVFVGLKGTIDEYKMTYVEQHREPIMAVLGNKIGSSVDLPKYNSYLLDELRKSLMWRKGR